jgi:hypothetical protein
MRVGASRCLQRGWPRRFRAGGKLAVRYGLCMSDSREAQGSRPRRRAGARSFIRRFICTTTAGLHISTTGWHWPAPETLVQQWPAPLTELVLIGHSMVARSACHYGMPVRHACRGVWTSSSWAHRITVPPERRNWVDMR